ncbi:hypothetical protein VKT23_014770 [Stygiomarasmius scandens]|uniref:Uncharacterized protein n=1 Tax=Marasmiellus scandens TaxID=2682957 RepID=A0ABR1J322_9AGAR
MACQLKHTGEKVPRKIFETLLLGPQLQALFRSPEGSTARQYRDQKTQDILASLVGIDSDDRIYDDIFCGEDYLKLLNAPVNLKADDTVFMMSFDGAQLYQNKQSDMWIWIFVILDVHPNLHYKNKRILVGGTIPGPKKPKNIDSFLFCTFHHIRALQCENNGAGLKVWDANKNKITTTRPIPIIFNADTVGLPDLDGRVGHHGARSCRLGCNMKGRHKPGSGIYYSAHLCPHNYAVDGCTHPDILPEEITSTTAEQYNSDLTKVILAGNHEEYIKVRKETGISKPSILLGLDPSQMLQIPYCFTVDLMHLFLNLATLFLALWRGTIDCAHETDDKSSWDWRVLIKDIWKEHGQAVADATPYFPSSFHRPPRNPAEKISSGYKTQEFYLYLFGLGPAVFRNILPEKYYQNFCCIVRAVRPLMQRTITGKQWTDGYEHMLQFLPEFEQLYYQRRPDRLHFCQPVIHTCVHAYLEVLRLGPGPYYTQYTLERIIGDIGKEV